MDVTLLGIVSNLLVNLNSTLSEVSELAFERLVDGTAVGKICGMPAVYAFAKNNYY